jgi:glycosyltransferase involved in cell wall biosynthesis
MRIGMMADVYKPHVSGITNYICLNKAHLERLGHEVYVFTFGGLDYADEEANIFRSPGIPLLDTGYSLSVAHSRAAEEAIETMDVVHVHHPFVSGTLAVRYCQGRNIPIIFTNHTRYDLYAQVYLPGLASPLAEAAVRSLLPRFCRACAQVVSPSSGMLRVMRELGVEGPVVVAPNGVDLGRFQGTPQPAVRQRLGFSARDVVAVYVGRLGPEKNLGFLLQAFRGAAQAAPDLKLLLVGDGPQRAELEAQAAGLGLADRVRFTGMLEYAEVPGCLWAADLFVTASLTEVHPLSLIEAMAAGLPALGIRSPGIEDTLQPGETGWLAGREDLAEFSAWLVRLALEGEARRRMGAQAQAAAGQYAIERTVQNMLLIYHQTRDLAGKRLR